MSVTRVGSPSSSPQVDRIFRQFLSLTKNLTYRQGQIIHLTPLDLRCIINVKSKYASYSTVTNLFKFQKLHNTSQCCCSCWHVSPYVENNNQFNSIDRKEQYTHWDQRETENTCLISLPLKAFMKEKCTKMPLMSTQYRHIINKLNHVTLYSQEHVQTGFLQFNLYINQKQNRHVTDFPVQHWERLN